MFKTRKTVALFVMSLALISCNSDASIEKEVSAYQVNVNGQTIAYTEDKLNEDWILSHLNDDQINMMITQLPIYNEIGLTDTKDVVYKIKEIYDQILVENKEEVIQLTIGDQSWLLSSEEEAIQVIKSSIENLLEYNVNVEIGLKDNQIVINEISSIDSLASIENIEVLEPITTSKTLANQEEVLPVDQAVSEITKKNEKPTIYEVQAGDVAGTIAENHDMSLKSLYNMNPSLEDREKYLQVGEALVVTIPKADITLKTLEIISYEEVIEKSYTYVEDDSLYVGTYKTLSYGSHGTMEVSAQLEKVDGIEVSRQIIDEQVVLEPINAVIASGTKALPEKGSLGNFVSPLEDYVLTSLYGPRWNSQHRGIDMAAPTGTSVRASDGGTVSYAGWWGSYGYLVEIDHGNGFKTRYGHNSKINVAVGQVVSQYEQIAFVGNTGNSTGPHLHFEIMIDDIPVDPYLYLE